MKTFKNILFSKRIAFDQAGFFVILLMVVAWFGFGPSYFRRLSDSFSEFNVYFHFHALCMVLWLITVFVQPVLIRRGKTKLHKLLGKFTYVLFPIVMLSTLLLIHSQLRSQEEMGGTDFFIPFKDVVLMSLYYILGIVKRKKVQEHVRFMVCTIIPMIEPALVRALIHSLPGDLAGLGYPIAIGIIDALIVWLVYRDFKKQPLRWIFISLLLLMSVNQLTIFSGWTELDLITNFAYWFASLPLT